MSTDHNRIKVADLETNESNKILTTNTAGELEFSDINFASTEYVDTQDDLKVDKVAGERLINASEITNLSNQSGVNTGDNAVNSNYESDYRASNFISGTNYLTPNGSASALTGFPVVSSTVSGIVDNTSLQELGGVDKLINGVRVGRGGGSIDTNIVLGSNNALSVNTTGDKNIAIGAYSLDVNTTGAVNIAVGYATLTTNTTGGGNNVIGSEAMYNNTTGNGNNAIGQVALARNTTGSFNSAMGSGTAYYNTTGSFNSAVGGNALRDNITGNDNVAIGSYALSNNLASSNIGVGYGAGNGITTGARNVVIGTNPTLTYTSSGITTGSNNLIVAQNNGNTTGITTGSGNTIIGKVTGLSASLSNTIVLSDGVGTQRFISNSANLSTLPAQTTALITGDGTGKAILTKEYLGTRIGTVAPTSSAAAGTVGEIRVAAGYVYWYVTGTGWLRSAGVTF